jgi:glycosyltransferase involved in cell wall biosynthesis
MRIVFAVKALGNSGGGAERVLSQVASRLASRGHHVTLLTSDARNTQPFYPLDCSINVVAVGVGAVSKKSSSFDMVRRMISYRRAIRLVRPDVVVGFMHSSYIPVGLALIGTGIPLVASEHIGPEHYVSRPLERLALQLTPLLSKRTTVVTEQIRRSFRPWLQRRMVVVANPVVVTKPPCTGQIRDDTNRCVLLSVGRLAAQKDFRTLISAFALIAELNATWVLRIVGEGALRSELEAQVKALGIEDRVEMPGAVADVDAEYLAADVFVLPSLYESFGLATAEALLHGLPAVGFADCPGTNELILDGDNGVLVSGPDRIHSLAVALSALLSNPEERSRLSSASTEDLETRFGIEGVTDQWEVVLKDACA